jgi:outer membrane protein assembly factor BamE (lipoprotein component of BamABCDE complex)
MTRRTILLLPVLLISSACVMGQTTTGTPIEAQQVAGIEPGKTTRAEVAQLLGPPDEIVYSNREHDKLFEQAYLYNRSRRRQAALFLILFSTFRSDTRFDEVAVFFDPNGVVEHLGSRLDADTAEYGAPW